MEELSQLKILPHSVESEQYMLSSMLVNPDVLTRFLSELQADWFYRKEHQIIFKAILHIQNKSTIDFNSLIEYLKLNKEINSAGGVDYIIQLSEVGFMSIDFCTNCCTIIKERFTLRKLIQSATDIMSMAYNPNGLDVKDILDQAETCILNVKINQKNNSIHKLKDIVLDVIEEVSTFDIDNEVMNIPRTKFYNLDSKIVGLERGSLIILAGRPGMGKTSLAVNIAENVSLEQKYTSIIFSYEMPPKQLGSRIVASVSGVNLRHRKEQYSHDDLDKLMISSSQIKQGEFYIVNAAGYNTMDIKSTIRRIIQESSKELGCIVIDYVQIMSAINPSKHLNRATEIGEISRELKLMALEFNVTIILLSQLNRDVESRSDKRPLMSDLRESGALEQDADIILLLYRDDYYYEDSKDRGIAEVNVAKNRSGETGTIRLLFDKQLTKFKNLMDSNYYD